MVVILIHGQTKEGNVMKKGILLLLLVVLVFAGKDCQAKTIGKCNLERLENSKKDFKEIKGLNDEVIEWVNAIADVEGKELLSNDFNVDFSKAVKIYSGNELFEDGVSTKKEAIKTLKKVEYIWSLDVANGKDIYNVTIVKGKKVTDEIVNSGLLSEEELLEMRQNEGKWTVNSSGYYDASSVILEDRVNRIVSNMDYDMKDSSIVLCNGLSGIHYTTAIIMDKKNVKYLIPLYHMDVEGTDEQINSIKASEVDSSGDVYLYDAVKNAVNDMPEESDDIAGGGGIVLDSVYVPPVEEDTTSYVWLWYIFGGSVVLSFVVLLIKRRMISK